jgi:5'-nucleotidase
MLRLALLCILVVISACSARPVRDRSSVGLVLRILHMNDHHSRLGAERMKLSLEGRTVLIEGGSFALAAGYIRQREQAGGAVLKLHAGDALTGDLFFTLFRGQADADLMNSVCFDAFAVGNHEFDHGDAGLRRFLDHLRSPAFACETAVLGANVAPRVGESPLALIGANDYLKPYAVFERDGERIGVIGLVIAEKTRHSSRPDPGTAFLDELATARRYIDILRAEGIEHILLLTHVGYGMDLRLAQQLPAVDAIIGGDSHTLLGDAFAALGLKPAGPYPTVVENADGDPVCVVQAWQYAWVVGELKIRFDAKGRVLGCEGEAVMPIAGFFDEQGVAAGAEAQAALASSAASLGLRRVEPDPVAERLLRYYEQQLEPLGREVVAKVSETLCVRRLPGAFDRGRDGVAGCAELTDAQGGHVQQLVAQAMLFQGQRYGGADLSIQNGGGVRSGIPAGDLSVRRAYMVLPFANTLVRLLMSGEEIHGVLEDALEFLIADPHNRSGSYPYAGGLRWSVDLGRPRGSRVFDLEVRMGQEWRPLEPKRLYRVITNDFLAAGEDGYGGFAKIPPERREELGLEYAQAFLDFAREQRTLRRPGSDEMSTVRFVPPPAWERGTRH